MEHVLIKKCSVRETESVSFTTCSTTYGSSGEYTISFEDDGTKEDSLLSPIHAKFKAQYSRLEEIPENASIAIGPYVFKTGAKYKHGLSVPQVSSIDYIIEEIPGAAKAFRASGSAENPDS